MTKKPLRQSWSVWHHTHVQTNRTREKYAVMWSIESRPNGSNFRVDPVDLFNRKNCVGIGLVGIRPKPENRTLYAFVRTALLPKPSAVVSTVPLCLLRGYRHLRKLCEYACVKK